MNIRVAIAKHWRRLVGIHFILILLAFSVFFLTCPSHEDLFREPVPNGYHDFLKAVEVGSFDNRVFESDEATMRKVVDENQESIQHILVGLEKDCQVKFEPDHKKHADVLSGFSKITWVLIRRAQLLVIDGLSDQSYRAFLDAYNFAYESSRGGIFTDRLSSTRMKIKIMEKVPSIIPKLDSTQANEFLRLIDKIESDEENSIEKVKVRDACWNDAAYGYSWRVDRVKFYLNRVFRERSLSSLSMLFFDSDAYLKMYLSDYLAPVMEQLKKR